MNTQIVAVVIAECGKLFGSWLRNRPIQIVQSTQPSSPSPQKLTESPSASTNKNPSEIATGCVPCAIGHMGTCSGLLNEAMRFAKKDGIESEEVVDRVGMCLDELNAMERVDLRPELTINLSDWEKELADKVLIASRAARHELEALESVESLEKVAASTQTIRTHIWREWIKKRMKNLTPEDQEKIQQRVTQRISELTEEPEDEHEAS